MNSMGDPPDELTREHSNQDRSTLGVECDDCRDIQQLLRIASELITEPGYFELIFPTSKGALGFCLTTVGQRFRETRDTLCQLCLMLRKSRIDKELSTASPEKNCVEEDADELRALPFTLAAGLVREDSPITGDSLALFIGRREVFEGKGSTEKGFKRKGSQGQDAEGRDSEVISKVITAAQNGVAVLSGPSGVTHLFIPRQTPDRYDPATIRSWIEYCQRHHKLCLPESSVVKDLKLIDCETRMMRVAAPDDQYVALSYVWGKPGSHSDRDTLHVGSSTEPLAALPKVIDDAISVTRSLGYRYIWVDKFCIGQEDSNTKRSMIQQMHVIYEKAELTIVAASGSDQHYGLAGVSTRRLGNQMAINLGTARLSWVIDPQHSIRGSQWSTRAWTFQEAVLSRRRLVFTEEQVYFECNAMNCCEGLDTPLDSLHIKSKTKIRDVFRAGMFGRGRRFGRMNPATLSAYYVYLQYCACVEDYSTRELMYDTDALSAFLGIIYRFRSQTGSPLAVVQGLSYPANRANTIGRHYFCHSLCWHHRELGDARRRPQFPSWTWVGWSGAVHFPTTKYDRSRDVDFHDQFESLAFEDESGTRWTLAQNEQQGQASDRAGLVLCLEARMIPASSITYAPRPGAKQGSDGLQGNTEAGASWKILEYDAILYLSERGITDLQLSKELNEEHRWGCIYVGSERGSGRCWVMLLKKMGGEIWSRAGLFQVCGCEAPFIPDDVFPGLHSSTEYKIG
ncbi:putative tol protein [Rosellinia necatrix]|uniref:Putative tol protein n=1 Tax=Rosellinia necatrix TaxID=77044 RepID=A0A1S8A7T5_ROSNE|nr:putative tol protein [Rosellinia necatrix]